MSTPYRGKFCNIHDKVQINTATKKQAQSLFDGKLGTGYRFKLHYERKGLHAQHYNYFIRAAKVHACRR